MSFFTQPPIQCCLALEENPLIRLPFESFPQTITEGYRASYSTQGNRGRASHTLRAFYKGGSYDDFSLELTFVAGLNRTTRASDSLAATSLNQREQSRDQKISSATDLDLELQKMEAKVRWLQAMLFPKPKLPRTQEQKRFLVKGDPPKILIVIGSFLTLRCVASSWNSSWQPPFHVNTARPFAATVNITFVRIGEFYPDWYDIAGTITQQSPLNFALGGLGTTVNQNQVSSPPVISGTIANTIG